MNSDLFKERAANVDLSNHIKDLLSELEILRRNSLIRNEATEEKTIVVLEEEVDHELIQTQTTQRRLSNLREADKPSHQNKEETQVEQKTLQVALENSEKTPQS